MKILFIHNDYARHSGEEHACEGIAELLVTHGHEIVWYRRSSAEIAGSVWGHARAFVAALHNPAAARAVATLVKTEKPDVAFVQNLYPLISPSVLSVLHRHGLPIVMRCPNYRLFCPNGLHFVHGAVCQKCLGVGREWWCVLRNCEGAWLKSAGYALRNAAARVRGVITRNVETFIVLSEFQRLYFMAEGIPANRLSVVPNMIPQRGTAGLEPGRGSVIGFIGRIAEEKGFDDFVAAAKRLPHLKFAAAGSVKAGYEKGVSDLPSNLKMMGFLTGSAFDAFVADMQMLVTCSSWFEGFPNTIAHAMASGRPVIATSIGAIPEIVEDGVTGLLYTPGDVDALTRHVTRLAGDAGLRGRMGAAGRRKATRCYAHEAVYAALLAALNQAQNNAASRT